METEQLKTIYITYFNNEVDNCKITPELHIYHEFHFFIVSLYVYIGYRYAFRIHQQLQIPII